MSLHGLGVGRIDLFHLHRIDPKVPLTDQEAAPPRIAAVPVRQSDFVI
jgi:aryl-alcohol dehydrogenase-like predicted oxidoreductase